MSLTACGGGDDYCDALRAYDADQGLADANFRTEEGMARLLDVLVDLRENAPDDLRDQYDTLIDAIRATQEDAADVLDREAVVATYEEISTDARDRCDVDMG